MIYAILDSSYDLTISNFECFSDEISKNLKNFYCFSHQIISYPFCQIIESKLVNRLFSWRPAIEPLTEKSIVNLKSKIEALTNKINGLDQAYESVGIKGLLSPYELLLSLRCLQFCIKAESDQKIPDYLTHFLELLYKNKLLLIDPKNLGNLNAHSKSSVDAVIKKFSALPVDFFRGRLIEKKPLDCLQNHDHTFPSIYEIISPKLLSSHFNRKEPELSFTQEEWKVLSIIKGEFVDVSLADSITFFNQLAILISDQNFLGKLIKLQNLANTCVDSFVPFCQVEGKVYSLRSLDAANKSWFKEYSPWIDLIQCLNNERKSTNSQSNLDRALLTKEIIRKWKICENYLPDFSEFLQSNEVANLSKEAQLLIENLKSQVDPQHSFLFQFFKNMQLVEAFIKEWDDLPNSPLEWTEKQTEFTYHLMYTLGNISNSPLWEAHKTRYPQCQIVRIIKQINESGISFPKSIKQGPLPPPPPMDCKNIGEYPLGIIFTKIKKLSQLAIDNKLTAIKKSDKLYLREFLFMQKHGHFFSLFLPKEEFKNYQSFIDRLKIDSQEEESLSINILMMNLVKSYQIDHEANLLSGGSNSIWRRIALQISRLLDPMVFLNGSTFVSIRENGKYFSSGLDMHGIFSHEATGKLKPKFDSFKLNARKLGQRLHVQKNKLDLFEAKFKECFLRKIREKKPIQIAAPIRLAKRFSSIKPFFKPENFKVDCGQKLLCNEFVFRTLIESACCTLKDLNQPLPQNMRAFGLGFFEGIDGITPDRTRRIGLKLGFFEKNQRLEQYVVM